MSDEKKIISVPPIGCEIIRRHFGDQLIHAFPAGTIEAFHMEGDVMVIDKFEMLSASITPESFARMKGLEIKRGPSFGCTPGKIYPADE